MSDELLAHCRRCKTWRGIAQWRIGLTKGTPNIVGRCAVCAAGVVRFVSADTESVELVRPGVLDAAGLAYAKETLAHARAEYDRMVDGRNRRLVLAIIKRGGADGTGTGIDWDDVAEDFGVSVSYAQRLYYSHKPLGRIKRRPGRPPGSRNKPKTQGTQGSLRELLRGGR